MLHAPIYACHYTLEPHSSHVLHLGPPAITTLKGYYLLLPPDKAWCDTVYASTRSLGLWFLRPTSRSVRFLRHIERWILDTHQQQWDQAAWNEVCHSGTLAWLPACSTWKNFENSLGQLGCREGKRKGGQYWDWLR